MPIDVRRIVAAMALAAPLCASASLVVKASVADCAQFSGNFNTTNCPTSSPGNFGQAKGATGSTGASVNQTHDYQGYTGASMSHAAEAWATQGVIHMRGSMTMNVHYDFSSALGGWSTAGGGWSEMLTNQVVRRIDLPFDITGGFDWREGEPPSSGSAPGYASARGRLFVSAMLVPQTPGLPFIFDDQVVDFFNPLTPIDEHITLHLDGLESNTNYFFMVGVGFETRLATQPCGSRVSDCLLQASASGDLSHTALLRAATFYDANGNPIQGGLTSESGYDYQKDAVEPGGGGGTPVPAPATLPLLALGLGLLRRARRPR